MSNEINFKNKKQSHILNKIHYTTFSTKKYIYIYIYIYHTTKIITRSILLKNFKEKLITAIIKFM